MKIIGIVSVLLVISCTLILSLPEFAIHQPDFKISSDLLLATGQVVVGIIFLGSLIGGALLGILVLFWFWPEIICEVALKKRTLKIIQARKSIHLSDLAETIGVYEDELGTLLQHWVAAWNKFRANPTKDTFSGNHLTIDLVNKEISWVD